MSKRDPEDALIGPMRTVALMAVFGAGAFAGFRWVLLWAGAPNGLAGFLAFWGAAGSIFMVAALADEDEKKKPPNESTGGW